KWTSNHYRWIVWKLAGMQSAWTHLSNEPKLVVPALCPEEIVRELLYRYQREICQVDRSCLHKIVERDELPARPMVLCIAQCIEQQTAPPDAGSTSSQQYLLELSDGWHSVVATVDTTLESAIRRGKLRVGSKISVVGASL
ncbi:BRCA2, oligonucleotide/oligosaccharide-binding, domain 1-domain-containing protein, partial [Blastocladiella britannica]